MISQTALAGLTDPIRCTPTTNSKSAISILAKDLSRSTPALAIRMSIRPQASIACLTIRATPASSVTDEPLAIASPPSPLISSTTLAAASDEPPEPSTAPPRSLTTTLAPRRASSSACWRPSPPPAPVTIATLPSKRMSAMASLPLSGLSAGLLARTLAGRQADGRVPTLLVPVWMRDVRKRRVTGLVLGDAVVVAEPLVRVAMRDRMRGERGSGDRQRGGDENKAHGQGPPLSLSGRQPGASTAARQAASAAVSA